MKIDYMKAARTLTEGSYAYDAEMKVELNSDKCIFLHANYSDGDHFTVADESFFGALRYP